MNSPELRPTAALSLSPELLRRVETVWSWAGLRGEPKCAWFCLYVLQAAGRPVTLSTSPAAISAALGTTERSGLRALENLAAVGLIDLIDRRSGRWTVFVNDPCDVATARRARHGNGQAELFATAGDEPTTVAQGSDHPPQPPCVAGSASAAAEATADVAQQPPSRNLLTFKEAQASKHLNIQPSALDEGLNVKRVERLERGGNGATTAAAAALGPAPGTIGVALAGRIANLPTDAEQAERAADLADWIVGRVGDPKLRTAACLRMAADVVEGRWPIAALNAVIASVAAARAAGRIRTEPWNYFLKAAAKSRRDHDRSLR